MLDIPHLKDLLGKASPGMAFYEERNEKLKNELRANAAELLRLAEIGAAANQIGNIRAGESR